MSYRVSRIREPRHPLRTTLRMTLFDTLPGRCVLERTPDVLTAWLGELPDAWLDGDEGPGTWSPRSVLGHLIEAERSDWMPRVRHLLEHGDRLAFPPFDRSAHIGRPPVGIHDELTEFARLRERSLAELAALRLDVVDMDRRGRHPAFGVVTLGQLLATWSTHDLSHLAQIARVMARRQTHAIGPWRAYLPIVDADRTMR